jgi:hypothetical protein
MRSFALLLGIVVTTSALHAQGPAVVSGVVRDETGSPVREALVVIDPDSLSLRARTGSDGRFRIPGVPHGRYEVRVVRIGFRPVSRTIDVTGRTLEFEVELRTVPIPLDTVAVRVSRPGLYGLVVTRGIALLPHEPRPIRGARVEILNEPHSTRSAADGRFTIPQLAIGSHSVLVTLDGFATRLVPVSVPPDGGVDITVTLDSLYADYQFRDQDQMRGIRHRVIRATHPATFVPAHEIDPDAPNLRDALRYAHSVLSRGVILQNAPACIYVDGRVRPDLVLHEIPPADIAGIEVYPRNTLQTDAGVTPGNSGTPCGGIEGSMFSTGERDRSAAASRQTLVRTRGNRGLLILIWTTRYR